MARKIIDATFDRLTVNNVNDMFGELYDGQIDDATFKEKVRQYSDETTVDEIVSRTSPEIKSEVTNSAIDFLKSNPDLFKGDSGDKVNYLKVDGLDDFTAFLKISDNDYAASRYFKDSTDEFLKGYQNYIVNNDATISEKLINENYTNVSAGTMTGTTGNNHYTSNVGTKITYQFTGYYIDFSALCNTTGGLWKAYIDGVEKGTYSVYASSAITKTFMVADNLTDTAHTLTLEFMGADPQNVISSPRGWIRFDSDGDGVGTTFTVKHIDLVQTQTLPANFTINFSNKEYALSVRDAAKTQTAEWFPAHNNIITTFKGQNFVRELIVDGNKVSLDKVSDGVAFKKATLIQKIEHKLSVDTSARAEVTFIVTFEDGKVYNEIKIKWLQDSEITSGYIMQMPFSTEWFDRVVSDKFEVANEDVVNTGTSTQFNDLNARTFTATSETPAGKNYIYRMSMLEMSEPYKEVKLAHRDTTLQKLYPQNYKYTVKTAGTIDYFKGFYEFSRIPNANLVYKV
ncbi:hypothetical protein [Staphylococcus simulans]|uniref:hypothetical protein n=1 Tax=Staphylococcus simulans TaxID=1286 RepID=UPI003CF89F67